MANTASQPTSFIAAMVGITGITVLRVLVFRWVCQSRGHRFHALVSLRKLLQVLGSFCIPGLGQASQGRFEAASLQLISFGTLWLFVGWYALPIHFVSALESLRRR